MRNGKDEDIVCSALKNAEGGGQRPLSQHKGTTAGWKGTFNEASFAREYESVWPGTVEDAFFNAEVFDKHRVLNQPEYEYSGRSSKDAYYVISVDVGRKGCASADVRDSQYPRETQGLYEYLQMGLL